jgi:hypothetical protein
MSIAESPLANTILAAMDAAIATPREVVVKHIDQSRRAHPDASPAELCVALDRRYLAAVTSTGAAAGAVAAAPGVGVAPSLVLAGGDAVAFISASALLALAYAEINGVTIDDLERRRTLIMAVMLGDSGAATVTRVAERTGAHWGKKIVASIPMTTIRQVNRVLGRNFVTKYGTKQGILVLGKTIPFGVGAVIGAGGNCAFGFATVRAARLAFGEPPAAFPPNLGPGRPGGTFGGRGFEGATASAA